MKEKYLPVGTIVILKGATKRLMIIGFCGVTKEQEGKVFDYTACLYPEGLISSEQICLFDHEQIDQVFFQGFVDEEEISFKKKLKELDSEINGTNSNAN